MSRVSLVVIAILILLNILLGFFWRISYLDKQRLVLTNAICKANNKVLSDSISLQNKEILKLKVDYNTSIAEWEQREPSVVYVDRWLTEYVDRNISVQGDCNEVLNAIRNNGGF